MPATAPRRPGRSRVEAAHPAGPPSGRSGPQTTFPEGRNGASLHSITQVGRRSGARPRPAGPFHADPLAAGRRCPSLFPGTARPGNACVSPANGTARPPPIDAGETPESGGRAVPRTSVSGAASIRSNPVHPREPIPRRETTLPRPAPRLAPCRDPPEAIFGADRDVIHFRGDVVEPLDIGWEAAADPDRAPDPRSCSIRMSPRGFGLATAAWAPRPAVSSSAHRRGAARLIETSPGPGASEPPFSIDWPGYCTKPCPCLHRPLRLLPAGATVAGRDSQEWRLRTAHCDIRGRGAVAPSVAPAPNNGDCGFRAPSRGDAQATASASSSSA